MEARAVNRFVGTSPRKMMLVIDLIRGRNVEEALTILHFSPKHAARTAEKLLRSAVSNLQNKDEAGRVEPSSLYVKAAYVDGGPSMKRIMPAPMGRAYRIRKRSHHLTIVIAKREEKAKPAPVKAETAAETKQAKKPKNPAKAPEKKPAKSKT